jgi:hypothetical protein
MKGFIAKHSKRAKNRPSGDSVHVVYLVPADKTARNDYTRAVRRAIKEIQTFYQEELEISRSK